MHWRHGEEGICLIMSRYFFAKKGKRSQGYQTVEPRNPGAVGLLMCPALNHQTEL